jgi:hypothetical protein
MAKNVVENGVKLVGETLLPGTSLMLDGDIKGGLGHAVVGILARMALGPIGLVAVAADSYAKSVTGKGLLGHLSFSKSSSPAPVTTTPARTDEPVAAA